MTQYRPPDSPKVSESTESPVTPDTPNSPELPLLPDSPKSPEQSDLPKSPDSGQKKRSWVYYTDLLRIFESLFS